MKFETKKLWFISPVNGAKWLQRPKLCKLTEIHVHETEFLQLQERDNSTEYAGSLGSADLAKVCGLLMLLVVCINVFFLFLFFYFNRMMKKKMMMMRFYNDDAYGQWSWSHCRSIPSWNSTTFLRLTNLMHWNLAELQQHHVPALRFNTRYKFTTHLGESCRSF